MARITAERLRSLLLYYPDTGKFVWRESRGNQIKMGDRAGVFDQSTGYVQIYLCNKAYYAHRLAWLYMTGEWPKHQVDHKNRVRDDNRWPNLREATHSDNCRNIGMSSRNTSGVRGVSWDKSRQKWAANISVRNKKVFLGRFDDIGLAARAYEAAAEKHFGEFAPVG